MSSSVISDQMDVESSSAFSPAEPVVDGAFVSKHNLSAEAYQGFKECADTLLSGKVPQNEQLQFLQRTLQICENVILNFEDEKQHLMSDVLLVWAMKQQKLSIATLHTQQLHYKELDLINLQFEYFGELLQQTLSGLDYLKQYYPNVGFEEIHVKVRNLAHYFLYYSIIVSRQPPSVIVKCGEAENHRRSRFWFNTEIRILGGSAFGIDTNNENSNVNCYLITDETAKQLLNNAYLDIFESEEFCIEPSTAAFQKKDARGIKAKFDDMKVAKKVQLRRDSVATKRYCLCYNIQLQTNCGIELVGKKGAAPKQNFPNVNWYNRELPEAEPPEFELVSLPFAVLVGPKADVEAKLFLERSFADLVRHPLSDIPTHVSCAEMADALEMKFQAIIETPQKNTDGPSVVQPRKFAMQTKQHLVMRMKPNQQGFLPLDNFMKLPVAEEFQQKKSTAAAATDGDWKLVPFYDWFFKLAEIVNKYLYSMWYDGLIFGFCSKEDAENILRCIPRSVLLVRFSDIEYAKIKISVKSRTGEIRHHWYEHADLNSRSLTSELLTNHKFADVDLIYPDIDLEVALGGRDKPRVRLPRNLAPDEIYFDNQGAAT
uniref:SH2 domain-containing protein n=1 Tax=Caenorhabditis japonica TaxID=281687 RepID=A0A8R1DPM3_CAEJA